MRNIKPYTEHIMESANDPKSLGMKILKIIEKRKMSLPLRTENIRSLINAGADVNVADRVGWTPLHWAVDGGNQTDIMKMLIDAGADVNATNIFGQTPLHFAAVLTMKKQMASISLLIESRARVNEQDPKQGRTPLHEAARFGIPEAVRILVDAGADIEAVNKDGLTPLGFITRLKDGFFGPSPKKNARTLILLGADVSRGFDSIDELKDFFDGDIRWVTDGPGLQRLEKMQRSKRIFGRG
jgi:ankyrin repeat protein